LLFAGEKKRVLFLLCHEKGEKLPLFYRLRKKGEGQTLFYLQGVLPLLGATSSLAKEKKEK